jgi:glucokinase
MYLGIDVGGTKTLLAVFDDQGQKVEEVKIPTSKVYDDFIKDVGKQLEQLNHKDFIACGAGIPSTKLDRSNGVAHTFGNLDWKDVPIKSDLSKLTNCPVIVENDAKLAAVSEALILKDSFSDVLYVTISTGIGYGLVKNGQLDTNIGDGGGRTMLIEHEGKDIPWEDFAGGRALFEKYGKQAKDIEDERSWRDISSNLAKGFIELIAITEPQVIVIGGSVGNYFDKFATYLKEDIENYKIPKIDMPELKKAQRPDEAVVYGCYDIARQNYDHATTNN